MRAFFTLPILLLAAASGFAQDSLVVLAANRSGRIDAFDQSLGRLGSIGVNQLVESISVNPAGRRIYIAQESRGECCGLYTLEMDTHRMCPFAGPAPAMFAVPSPDGNWVFTQTGLGLQAYSADKARPGLKTMKASGPYNLQPSPDGKWLLGLANSGRPSLDVFDLRHMETDFHDMELDHRIAIPTGPAAGAWAGDSFYVFTYAAPGLGKLWSVKPEDTQLSQPREIRLPDVHGSCNEPVLLMLAGAPGKLFLAEAFGYKVDRRNACPGTPGGVHVIEPSTGHVSRMAESVHVNRMAVSPDGQDLYVIESGSQAKGGDVRLVHFFNRTSRSIALESGDWSLAVTHTPYASLPRGYVRAPMACH